MIDYIIKLIKNKIYSRFKTAPVQSQLAKDCRAITQSIIIRDRAIQLAGLLQRAPTLIKDEWYNHFTGVILLVFTNHALVSLANTICLAVAIVQLVLLTLRYTELNELDELTVVYAKFDNKFTALLYDFMLDLLLYNILVYLTILCTNPVISRLVVYAEQSVKGNIKHYIILNVLQACFNMAILFFEVFRLSRLLYVLTRVTYRLKYARLNIFIRIFKAVTRSNKNPNKVSLDNISDTEYEAEQGDTLSNSITQ